MESLAASIAQAITVNVRGSWQRHAPARYASKALEGRSGLGRWSTQNAYPVLYLGQPTDSVIVEAYRHLVDPVEDYVASAIPPRVLVTCDVSVTEVLDIRSPSNRILLDLSMDVLQSGTRDRAAYQRCQEVAAVAHQLGLHGILAPAATMLGDTLALFTDQLPASEQPGETGSEMWTVLPSDPRVPGRGHLRLLSDGDRE